MKTARMHLLLRGKVPGRRVELADWPRELHYTVSSVGGVPALCIRLGGGSGPLVRCWPLAGEAAVSEEIDLQKRALLKKFPGYRWVNNPFKPDAVAASVGLLLVGTAFQCSVWEALTGIPDGKTTPYRELAAEVATPRHARAVGTAVGANVLAWFIPCHRVVCASGGTGGFRWGTDLKARWLSEPDGRG